MKQLSKYKLKKISNNLDQLFDQATAQDIKNGLNWYKEANNICKDIAIKYNTTTMTAAGVISALSPRNKWDQNIKDTYTVFEAVKNNLGPEDVKVCTFNKNKFKAFAIAKNEIFITDKSLKTFNFVNNIANLDSNYLTVDIWHLRACLGKKIKIDSASIGRIAYKQIKALTIKKAQNLGLKGFELQAVLWVLMQRIYKY